MRLAEASWVGVIAWLALMIKAVSLDISVNLLGFTQLLQKHGLAHRITEEAGQQLIWANSETDAELVRRALQKWSEQGAAVESPAKPKFQNQHLLSALKRGFGSSPVTLCLFAICILVAVASALGARPDRVLFLFFPLLPTTSFLAMLGGINSLSALLQTFTPMFLHFGELHLIFNMLWLWYFGKQLENLQGKFLYIALVLITSFVSNVTQYLSSDYNNFGGMSGVVYGMVGYTFVLHSLMPRSPVMIERSMFIVFVIALVAMEVVASSWVATAAHIGGLVSGCAFAVLVAAFYRLVLKRTTLQR